MSESFVCEELHRLNHLGMLQSTERERRSQVTDAVGDRKTRYIFYTLFRGYEVQIVHQFRLITRRVFSAHQLPIGKVSSEAEKEEWREIRNLKVDCEPRKRSWFQVIWTIRLNFLNLRLVKTVGSSKASFLEIDLADSSTSSGRTDYCGMNFVNI